MECLPVDWKVLEIRNLNFAHRTEILPVGEAGNEKKLPGLHQINLRLQRGKRIALIGESGSGKSTVLALLRGLYQPDVGTQLLVDGAQKDLVETGQRIRRGAAWAPDLQVPSPETGRRPPVPDRSGKPLRTATTPAYRDPGSV